MPLPDPATLRFAGSTLVRCRYSTLKGRVKENNYRVTVIGLESSCAVRLR
jgi:hypothetical protein